MPQPDPPPARRETRIEVRGADGSPVEGAAVTVAASGHSLPELAHMTDTDGAVRLTLPVGPLAVTAHHGGHRGQLETILDTHGTTPLRVVLDTGD